MTCEEALELISAKIDNELNETQQAELQAHLETCAQCRSVLEAMTGLEEGLAGLEEPAPEGLKRGVLYRIGQETGKKAKRRWIGPGTGFGLVAAALLLLVGTGVIPLQPNRQTDARGPASTSYDRTNGQKDGQYLLPDSNEDMNANIPDTLEPEGTYSNLPHRSEGSDAAGKGTIVPFPAEPDGQDATSDSYYLGDGVDSVTDLPRRAVDDALRSFGSELSRSTGGAVLLYTEFSPESILELLKNEAPELAKRLDGSLVRRDREGRVLLSTDYRTMLALHEWLLENLPQSEIMPSTVREAETSLMMRMQELDPDSGCLYSIISWSSGVSRVDWPEDWPAGWALRLRTEENWALFFPAEDYSPRQDDSATLVFFSALETE